MVRVYGSPWIVPGVFGSDAIFFCSAFVFGRVGDLRSRYLAPGCKRVNLRTGETYDFRTSMPRANKASAIRER